MSASVLESGHEPPAAPPPPRRNPFVMAFVMGALGLTVLPFLQRFMLRAPAPLADLGSWSLASPLGGSGPSDATLRGRPWIASFVPAPCDADCQASTATFGGATRHLSDLGDRVAMVTFVQPEALEAAQRAHGSEQAGGAQRAMWRLATGEASALEPVWSRFAAAWQIQTERLTSREIAFLARPTYAVVDQDGAIRGFWPGDEEGRGHAINAVRMFARHGPNP